MPASAPTTLPPRGTTPAPTTTDPARPASPAISRQVRRATARQCQRQAHRQAVHPAPADLDTFLAPASPAPSPPVTALPALVTSPDPAAATGLYATLLAWLDADLIAGGANCPRPARKRLALLVAGLLQTEAGHGTPHGVARAAFALEIGTATQEPSVVRRVDRLLGDADLDPQRVLPAVATLLLPVLLAEVQRSHDHTIGTRPAHATGHHRRWIGVRLVIDETSKGDQTHILAIGLAYWGVVFPLAVRTWPQNQPLPEGAYWTSLSGLLTEVLAVLPPVLRDHVLVLADRGYGVPTMHDLLRALGWQWVIRVQGQVRVLLPDGTTRALRELVPTPGHCWLGTATPVLPDTPDTPDTPDAAAGPVPLVGVFKNAGWRPLQVVAAWQTGEAEPWLLVTSLPAHPARLREYAVRWGVERLFLAWKSHGWNLEACGVTDPRRLGRLLTGYVLASWWLLAAAVPVAEGHLVTLTAQAAQRAARRAQAPRRPCQLPLPLDDLAPPSTPWAGKASLFTQGHRAFRQVDGRTTLPRLRWTFPDWDAPTWSDQCQQLYHGRAA